MRKSHIAILPVILIFLLSVSITEAQQLTVGGGVGYGSETEDINFQVNLYYKLQNAPLRVGGDTGYSKPESNVNAFESNANLHFMAIDKELFSLYSITGVNVQHQRIAIGDIIESETELGLNLGAGGEFDLGFGRSFGEIKYVIGRDSDQSQWMLGAGIRVGI